LTFNEKYKPLFQLLQARKRADESDYWHKLSKVHTVLISGGRDSSKSFSLATFNALAASRYGHRILLTRRTMSSTDNSVTKGLEGRMTDLGVLGDFNQANKTYTLKDESKKGLISVTGQKTSSGTETAKLKSLEDFSIFVTDEGEELVSFDEWNKIKRSLRVKDVQTLSIIAFNPPTKAHWLYEQWYQDVPEGFCGIKDNVLYIHTTYLDNGKKNITEANWNEYEGLRLNSELYESSSKEEGGLLPAKVKKDWKEYQTAILGGFKEVAEGVIYEDWEIGEFDENLSYIYGLDFGSNDPDALTKVAIDEDSKKIYLKEEYFKNNTSFEGLKNVLIDRCGYNDLIVADSAERRMIIDLRNEGLNIKKAKKGKGSVAMRIKIIQSYTLIADPNSKNLQKALNNYSWHDSKADVPNHDWSDLCDSFGYAVTDLKGFKIGML